MADNDHVQSLGERQRLFDGGFFHAGPFSFAVDSRRASDELYFVSLCCLCAVRCLAFLSACLNYSRSGIVQAVQFHSVNSQAGMQDGAPAHVRVTAASLCLLLDGLRIDNFHVSCPVALMHMFFLSCFLIYGSLTETLGTNFRTRSDVAGGSRRSCLTFRLHCRRLVV